MMFRGFAMAAVLTACLGMVAQAQAQACRTTPVPYRAPMDQRVVDTVLDIADLGDALGRNPRVFMVVGDSISGDGGAGGYYLGNCSYPYGASQSTYGWIDIKDLTCYPELIDSLDWFLGGATPGGTTSFTRNSIAAYPGRDASWAMTGSTPPVQQEIAAINPAYALIMFGANDIYGIDPEETWLIEGIVDDLLAIADYVAAAGIVPIMKTAPTRAGYVEQMELLAEYTRIAAADRGYPLIDVYAATWPLPQHGQGSDGIHFRYYDYNRMCVFHDTALNYGINMHNLVTLQMLDDLYRVVELDELCLDDCEDDTDPGMDTDSATVIDTASASETDSDDAPTATQDTGSTPDDTGSADVCLCVCPCA